MNKFSDLLYGVSSPHQLLTSHLIPTNNKHHRSRHQEQGCQLELKIFFYTITILLRNIFRELQISLHHVESADHFI